MPQTSMEARSREGKQQWELPPLILHPFADNSGTGKLVESSRANLMLYGLLPNEGRTEEDLTRRLLEGRYCEIRMLYFVGKDLRRWTGQCMDFVDRIDDLREVGYREASFIALLVDAAPDQVVGKLKNWGVSDHRSIFSRAIGLNAIFRDLPAREILTEDFVLNYYRYADHLYSCHVQALPYTAIPPGQFTFEMYASGEYSRMLARQWGDL